MDTSTGTMPSFFTVVERRAIDVGGRRLLHPVGEVADAQP
jgi:hypothetical protein